MKKLNQSGFHFIYLAVFIVIVAVIGFAGYRVISMQQKKDGGGKSTSKVDRNNAFLQQYGQNCDNVPTPTFSNSPVATDQIRFIQPMGAMMDGHVTPTDHVYVSPLNPKAADNSYNVVMPADGKIVQVGAMPASYIGDMAGQTVAPEDHRIVVSFNCRYFAIFIHVHQLSDAIKAEVGEIAPNENKQLNLSLKAGEPIGKIGGNPVDWTMVDVQTTLKGFITPSNYEREPWKIHSIDPFSVYTGNLREQLEAKSLRSKAPLGGKIDYDKAGALIGNWFKTGTNGYEGASQDRYYDGHLAVVPDYIDPDTTIVSIGNWEGKARQFVVRGDVDPSKATKANSPVKYELTSIRYITPEGADWNAMGGLVKGLKLSQDEPVIGTILFEVQDGNKIKIQKFPGKTADQVSAFDANAQTYER